MINSRLVGIDLFKCFACLLVSSIHSGPFKPIMDDAVIYKYLAGLLDQIARVAVPFFFITSSYLFAHNERKDIVKTCKRLLSIFIIWRLLYIIFPSEYYFDNGYGDAVALKLSEFLKTPWKLIFEGGRSHLWFLVSLVLAILSFAKMPRRLAMIISVLIYITGCMLGSYSKLVFGFDLHNIINTRNGIFVSGVCWTIGQYIYDIKLSDMVKFEALKKYAFILMAIGVFGHFTEVFILNKTGGISFIRHDYVISTILFSFGFFLVALKVNGSFISGKKSVYISRLSKLTLGIYLLHPMIIDFFNFFVVPNVSQQFIVVWQPLFVIVIFTTSAFLTLTISKNKYFRKCI